MEEWPLAEYLEFKQINQSVSYFIHCWPHMLTEQHTPNIIITSITFNVGELACNKGLWEICAHAQLTRKTSTTYITYIQQSTLLQLLIIAKHICKCLL